MSGGYGTTLPNAFAWWDPAKSSWKTCQACLWEDLDTFSGSWPRWGTMRHGEAFEQTEWVPAIDASESSLWPTPSASVVNDGEDPTTWQARADVLKLERKNGNGAGTPLTVASARWHQDRTASSGHQSSKSIPRLNPRFVEWMLNWPIGWTGSEPVATESYRSKLRSCLLNLVGD